MFNYGMVTEPYDDFVEKCKKNGIFDNNSLNISKILHADYTINLELLEIAVGHIVKNNDTIKITGFPSYCSTRGISNNLNRCTEEFNFIKGIVKNMASEFVESGKEIRVTWIIEETSLLN